MEKDDYFSDRMLVESLMAACQKELDRAEHAFEKEYWLGAVKEWKKILTNMKE